MKFKKMTILLIAAVLCGTAFTAYGAVSAQLEESEPQATEKVETNLTEENATQQENPTQVNENETNIVSPIVEEANEEPVVEEIAEEPAVPDADYTWQLGNDITAYLKDGELSIYGEGKARIHRPAGSKGYEYIPWIGEKNAQSSIKRVYIEDTVEISDMDGWFWFCSNLTDVSDLYIPDTCWRMDNTFYGCSSLTDVSSLDIPNSVTSLSGMLAHSGVTNVPDDLLPSKAEDISYLFCESALKDASNFIIPGTVKDAQCSFWKCDNLENIDGIVIPAGTNTFRMFGNDHLASGTITVKGTPSDYGLMFDWCGGDSSSGVVVNYTDGSVIENIVKTGEKGNVSVGTLVN